MGKPSLTWYFIAVAVVLVGGFTWLEFHQHAKALPSFAQSSDTWQPPKSNPKADINVNPATEAKPQKSKTLAMGSGSSKRLSLKDKMAKDTAERNSAPANRDDDPPERNYDDIPESAETTFATDSSEELNDEAVEATPEQLIMKGFGGNDPTKLSDDLQEEFDELDKDGGGEEAGDAKGRAKPQDPGVEPGEVAEEVASQKSSDQSPDQSPDQSEGEGTNNQKKIPIPKEGEAEDEPAPEPPEDPASDSPQG